MAEVGVELCRILSVNFRLLYEGFELCIPGRRADTTVRLDVRRRVIWLHMVLAPGASQRATDRSAHDQQKHDRGNQEECSDFHAEDNSWRSVIGVVDFADDRGFIVPMVYYRIFVGGRIVDGVVVLKARDGC